VGVADARNQPPAVGSGKRFGSVGAKRKTDAWPQHAINIALQAISD
jgi:hypothetical protein